MGGSFDSEHPQIGAAGVDRLPGFWRRVVVSIVVLFCAGLLTGCATPGPTSTAKQEAATAPSATPTEGTSQPKSDKPSSSEQIAKGALQGASAGAVGSAVMLAIGAIVFPPLGVPLAIGMAPVLIGGSAIAGVARTAIVESAPADTETFRCEPSDADDSPSASGGEGSAGTSPTPEVGFPDFTWYFNKTSPVHGRLLINQTQMLFFEPLPAGGETSLALLFLQMKKVTLEPSPEHGSLLCVVSWAGSIECFFGLNVESGGADGERTETAYRIIKARAAVAKCVGRRTR